MTIAWFTSALFSQMVDHEPGCLRRVRQVLAGGDVLSLAHVRKFLQASGTSILINGYGPTENTTFTCCYPMTATTQIGSSVPIGRPISNTQVYVLDAHLNPQPIGVPGELYVGGDGLARGYWNRSGADRGHVHRQPVQRRSRVRVCTRRATAFGTGRMEISSSWGASTIK